MRFIERPTKNEAIARALAIVACLGTFGVWGLLAAGYHRDGAPHTPAPLQTERVVILPPPSAAPHARPSAHPHPAPAAHHPMSTSRPAPEVHQPSPAALQTAAALRQTPTAHPALPAVRPTPTTHPAMVAARPSSTPRPSTAPLPPRATAEPTTPNAAPRLGAIAYDVAARQLVVRISGHFAPDHLMILQASSGRWYIDIPGVAPSASGVQRVSLADGPFRDGLVAARGRDGACRFSFEVPGAGVPRASMTAQGLSITLSR